MIGDGPSRPPRATETSGHGMIQRDPAEDGGRKFSKTDWKWLLVAFGLLVLFLIGFSWWRQDVEPVVIAEPSTFVVGSGGTLVAEYGYDDGITVAEMVGIPLSKRELGSSKVVPITYAQAHELRSQTDQNLVRAPLYPGDRILTMRYPNGRVDFENSFVLFTPARGSPELAKR